MSKLSWKVQITLILILLTLLLGAVHVLLFGDLHTLEFYLALDIVFVPIQVLLVSIVIERLLSERETLAKLRKLNMVIGAFMGELGTQLLRECHQFRRGGAELDQALQIAGTWQKQDYRAAALAVANCPVEFAANPDDFVRLRDLLLRQRPFVLGLLQNPNLLEHECFTDLLWAVCHLTEELECRSDFAALPESDISHLHGDIRRAYGLLTREWLSYLQHLQSDYPYIFSLSLRTNPFNAAASPIVR